MKTRLEIIPELWDALGFMVHKPLVICPFCQKSVVFTFKTFKMLIEKQECQSWKRG